MVLSKFDFLPRVEVSVHLYAFIIFTFCVFPVLALVWLEVSSRQSTLNSPRGCRKLGLRMRSNLADEYESQYAQGHEAGQSKDGEEAWRVKSLWVYPIKSCTGVELNRGRMVGTGLEYDRQFSFAQLRGPNSEEPEKRWTFITQRQYPLLARVKVELWVPDPESPAYSPKAADVQSEGVLIVHYPSQPTGWRASLARLSSSLGYRAPTRSFKVPFNPTPEQIEKRAYPTEKMTIWKDSPEALNMGKHVPADFTEFLGLQKSISLFRIGAGKEREVFRSAPRKDQLGRQPITGFADAFPVHMQNLASVRDVASRISDIPQLSARRFRPNIIITGPSPYAEDAWKKIRIGTHEFYVICRTARCRLPNVDPETGIRHPVEPDKTLKSFRCIDEGAGTNPCLGMEMVAAEEVFDIRVGEPIEVLETGEHRYIGQ